MAGPMTSARCLLSFALVSLAFRRLHAQTVGACQFEIGGHRFDLTPLSNQYGYSCLELVRTSHGLRAYLL